MIQGAIGSSYTMADGDEGKAIKVQASFTDDAGNPESLTSAATDAVTAAPRENNEATGAPTISGTAQVGETLTVDTSGISDADGLSNVQYEFQWIRNDGNSDSAISGATASTHTLADGDEGKTIAVEVSFTDDESNEETLTSAPTDAVAAATQPNTPATGTPTISGTAQVGETLMADTSGVSDEDGLENVTFSYQWLADDTDISGATDATYTLVEADEGKTIRVRASFTDDAGNEESLTSGATDAVAAAGPTGPPARPTGLSATATHDQVALTWDDPGTTPSPATSSCAATRTSTRRAPSRPSKTTPDQRLPPTPTTRSNRASSTCTGSRRSRQRSERDFQLGAGLHAGSPYSRTDARADAGADAGAGERLGGGRGPAQRQLHPRPGRGWRLGHGRHRDRRRSGPVRGRARSGADLPVRPDGQPGGGGTLPDTFFRAIYDSEGQYQADSHNDDFDGGRDSRVTFTPTDSGTYYARVSGDRDEVGSYTLSVTDVTPQ